MNEAETRAEHIDPALKAAGWGVVEGSRIRREYPIAPGRIEGHGRRGKSLTADYVLEYRNTRLAVVEAKAWDEELTEGVAQAKNYAEKLAIRFTYATNGHGIYEIDMCPDQSGQQRPPERELPAFPTPDELWTITFPSTRTGTGDAADKASELVELWRNRFAAIPFEDKGGSHPSRYYQEIAVDRVMEAIANNRQRILLTLATGTGKTFIAFQIAWKLFQSRWNLSSTGSETAYVARRPRILFLADRNILANQAYNNFSAFPEDAMIRIAPDEIAKKGKVPKNGSLFFTIFQTFASTGSATASMPATASMDESSALPEVSLPTDKAGGYMYILACADGSFYTGSTNNLPLRLAMHKAGEGAMHTQARLPVKLLYYEAFDRVDLAFDREKQVQGWSRAKKIALIKGDITRLKQLSCNTAEVPEPVEVSVPEPVEGYEPDFFDFIVIDECHRGGAKDESTWREILEYFKPAVQLGLTATPKRKDNVDTYAYFGEPVFIYSLKEGINDGFLTPFRVKQIATTLDDYRYAPDDVVMEGSVDEGKLYEERDFNRTLEIKEREKKRVELFLKQINPNEKTLVFCANQAHALLVRDLINQMKSVSDPNYCHRVTADDGALGEQYLRDFQDNEKTIPTILTTSQKLSTGVDARNIRNIVLMRPINSMIEFKQIIGRGTRLYDGKNYFTIYDFVKAHHHFSDQEWDGEPIDPATCPTCGSYPCICKNYPCPVCHEQPCVCRRKPCSVCGQRPCVCEKPESKRAKIKLADGKERNIQHMMSTTFWHADGRPVSAQQFMEMLFGKLPEFFKNEDELRALWSAPDTRRKLLQGLAEKGFGHDQLREMQAIINAEKSDLFDVLAYVAYALSPITREERASKARADISVHFNGKERAFLDFVLSHYVTIGVEELDQEKLTPLLRLKYHDSISDAIADLGGNPSTIAQAFASFQKYLYADKTVA